MNNENIRFLSLIPKKMYTNLNDKKIFKIYEHPIMITYKLEVDKVYNTKTIDDLFATEHQKFKLFLESIKDPKTIPSEIFKYFTQLKSFLDNFVGFKITVYKQNKFYQNYPPKQDSAKQTPTKKRVNNTYGSD